MVLGAAQCCQKLCREVLDAAADGRRRRRAGAVSPQAAAVVVWRDGRVVGGVCGRDEKKCNYTSCESHCVAFLIRPVSGGLLVDIHARQMLGMHVCPFLGIKCELCPRALVACKTLAR